MKKLTFLIFAGVCVLAAEGKAVAAGKQESLPVEDYKYGDHLDIKKVINIQEPPADCKAELEKMTYEDSNGKRHIAEFPVMAKCPGISGS